jgi:hypothetical protein
MEQQESQLRHNSLRRKMGHWLWPSFIVIMFAIIAIILFVAKKNNGQPVLQSILNPIKNTTQKSFADDFSGNYRLEETGKRSGSASPNWWLNSGGWMIISGGAGKTIQGDLDSGDKWFKNYKKNNPEDTDNGAHPQNIFRLVGRDKWQNFTQEVYFKINKMNFGESVNRNESNGFLLFNRYQDGDNLYYTGLRVDGYAVIKKKLKGDYHTLAEEKIFSGPNYDREKNPNLLPVGKWMGIKSVVKTNSNGDTEINLYYKENRDTGEWKLVSHYVDKGQKGEEITAPGYGGIRTDFMDVEFDDYNIEGN